MFWIEGMARNTSGLVLETITPSGGRERRETKELWQPLKLAGATTIQATTNCAEWQRESGKLFWEGLDVQDQNPKDCQGIFSVGVGLTPYLIPASVFIQATMRPLQNIHQFLFKPQGLESFCTPLFGSDKPNLGINLSKSGLFDSHNKLPTWFTGVYSWMSCFPSANRMWASVYNSANIGHLDIEMPQALLTMALTSVKYGEVNLVTNVQILNIETDEQPFLFAANHTKKIELYGNSISNQQVVKQHKAEILPRGNSWKLSDIEWTEISAILPRRTRYKYDLRAIIDLILVKLGTGCPWRLLPFDNLNFPIVQNTYHRLTRGGNWEEIKKILNMMRGGHVGTIDHSLLPNPGCSQTEHDLSCT
jgi:hypothetical protein